MRFRENRRTGFFLFGGPKVFRGGGLGTDTYYIRRMSVGRPTSAKRESVLPLIFPRHVDIKIVTYVKNGGDTCVFAKIVGLGFFYLGVRRFLGGGV